MNVVSLSDNFIPVFLSHLLYQGNCLNVVVAGQTNSQKKCVHSTNDHENIAYTLPKGYCQKHRMKVQTKAIVVARLQSATE